VRKKEAGGDTEGLSMMPSERKGSSKGRKPMLISKVGGFILPQGREKGEAGENARTRKPHN